jgi:hypothetical protein
MTGAEGLARANELLAAAEADPSTAAEQLAKMEAEVDVADDDPLSADVRGVGSMLFMMADAEAFQKSHPA